MNHWNTRVVLRGAAIALLFLSLAASSSAGDAFVRGGVIFHPRDLEFAGRWRANFGSDYAVNFAQTIYVGFEVQSSAFRQDVAGSERTATLVPINGFVNVKYKSGYYSWSEEASRGHRQRGSEGALRRASSSTGGSWRLDPRAGGACVGPDPSWLLFFWRGIVSDLKHVDDASKRWL